MYIYSQPTCNKHMKRAVEINLSGIHAFPFFLFLCVKHLFCSLDGTITRKFHIYYTIFIILGLQGGKRDKKRKIKQIFLHKRGKKNKKTQAPLVCCSHIHKTILTYQTPPKSLQFHRFICRSTAFLVQKGLKFLAL